ncbi:hypothetical protein I3843_10G103800 [Carya illinoinensis]|nr:hypothetical protein I3843_10G103800 [Carya illinoinensis]
MAWFLGPRPRCCLACVLPYGALNLIHIVHLNTNVEEIAGPITAGEILWANPYHVLTKPCSQGVVRKILIVSPDSELKRGSIYFLILVSSLLKRWNLLPTSLILLYLEKVQGVKENMCVEGPLKQYIFPTLKQLHLKRCERCHDKIKWSSTLSFAGSEAKVMKKVNQEPSKNTDVKYWPK